MTDLSEHYRLDNYIDTYALGHYARVFDAWDQRHQEAVAFKLMRLEHLSTDGEVSWEFRAFINEAELLTRLADNPHVVALIDCGYVAAQDEVPQAGQIVSFGRDVAGFARAMIDYSERHWRPYLVMPSLPRTHSLFYLMKPSQQAARWRLPTEEGLALAIQFAQVLQMAHQQNIVYLDHKLEHVYWDGVNLTLIDLNSSRQLDNRTTQADYFRMDVHNLCVGVLYSVFTGLSPVNAPLKAQPGSLAQVEARYQAINTLDFGVEPDLSPALQALLQRGAAGQIETISDFIEGLQEVASIHGWDFPGQHTLPVSRRARDTLRGGLRALREGQALIREARDLFREAAILDDIPEDLENELRRLVQEANAMLNQRVIP